MNGTYPVGTPQAICSIQHWAPYTYFAVNLNATVGPIGEVLWTNTVQPPAGNLTVSYAGVDPTASDGLGNTVSSLKHSRETTQFVGYSLTTGAQIWGPTATSSSL